MERPRPTGSPTTEGGSRANRDTEPHGIDERFVIYRRNGERRLRDELVEEHASLAYFLAQGRPLVDAAGRANRIAAISVRGRGTQTSFPDAAQLPTDLLR